jgi:2-polyprenyl-6-methoxyphenol hydroxylase-like FAD-dependent oxidoreductase
MIMATEKCGSIRASGAVDALVIGAGPVGLMMAGELARHGLSCRIIDKSDGPARESRAIGVWPRTLEVFEDAGVVDAILARGVRIHGNNVYADGKRIVHMTFDDPDLPFPCGVAIPQTDTEAVLAEAAARRGIEVERSTTLAEVHQDDASVTARLRGPAGDMEDVRVRWLIGCDGAHSAVRHALGVSFEGAAYADVWYAADVRLDWDLVRDELHNFLSPEGVLAVFALPGDRRVRLVYDAPNAQRGEQHVGGHGSHVTAPSLAEVQAAFDARTGYRGVLSDARWLTGFRIHRRVASAQRVGRVFLAGDAAHIHSPVGAQGMNTGLQDAYNLAWKIALVERGLGHGILVDSYQAERHPIAAGAVRGTDIATQMVTLRHPIARWARDRLIETIASYDGAQERLARGAGQLSVAYHDSPIVGEHRAGLLASAIAAGDSEHPRLRDRFDFGGGPRPGDRAPDARTTDGRRVFDLLRGTHHTLLLFDGAQATEGGYRKLEAIAMEFGARLGDALRVHVVVPSADRPRSLGMPVSVIPDAESAIHRAYGAASECLYLIRPDGYVAFRSQPADGGALGAYLGRVLVTREPVSPAERGA